MPDVDAEIKKLIEQTGLDLQWFAGQRDRYHPDKKGEAPMRYKYAVDAAACSIRLKALCECLALAQKDIRIKPNV